jgi:hypothetical protein
MQTFKVSREVILGAIRSNLPTQQVDPPRIPVFQRPNKSLKPEFDQHLQQAGGPLTILAAWRRLRLN